VPFFCSAILLWPRWNCTAMMQNNADSLSSEEIVNLKTLLTKLRNVMCKDRDTYGFSYDVPGLDHHIILLPKHAKLHSESSDRQKRRRKARLRSIVQYLKMNNSEAISALAKKLEIKKMVSSPILSPKHANALLMTRRFTKRDLEFLRNYFLDIPGVKQLRAAHWYHLNTLPPLHLLYDGSNNWKTMPAGRITLTSHFGRNVVAVRYNISEFITSRLVELISTNTSLKFLDLNSVPNEQKETTVPILFSLDSGTGTLKFMGKILLENSTQKYDEVFLLGEAVGSDESFTSIETYFGESAREIADITKNGIRIGSVIYTIYPIFVADFKVYYSITGGYGARSKYPCPWCTVLSKNMDCESHELLSKYNTADTKYLPSRPEIANLKNSPADIANLQKKGTYNIFNLFNGKQSNFVPPPLHIKLGLINKVLEVLDEVNKLWERKIHWVQLDRNKSPIQNHMRYALSCVKVKRQKYYSGQADGGGCTALMAEMELFCELYFDSELPCGGLVSDTLPNVINLKCALLRLSSIFNGNATEKGLLHFLCSSKKWNSEDLQSFETIVEKYMKEIKRSFWRPAGVANLEEPWRRPWLMPKLHSLIVHVKEVVMFHGYYGAFTEEGMEHMQQVSKRLRQQHAPNKSLGAQIVDDLQYNAVLSSPTAKSLRREAEELCVESIRPLKKRRFE